MIVIFPSLLGFTTENIREKVNFYDKIGLFQIVIIDPKKLMQSTSLSYARYMFYQNIGIDIDMSNYSQLFINQKYFVQRYHKTNKEIMDMYSYMDNCKKNVLV